MQDVRVYWLTCVVAIFIAAVAGATTIILPTDGQLVTKSPVIVEGTVVSSTPVDRGAKIWTESVISISKVVKGNLNVGDRITVGEIGGVIDNRITKIYGAPEYHEGERVLLFLMPTPRGDYQTVDLFVGKFTKDETLDGRGIWVRHDEGADATLLDANFRPITTGNIQRDAAGFDAFVDARARGERADSNYGVENPVLRSNIAAPGKGGLQTRDFFTMISEPSIYRWFAFDTGGSAKWYSYGSQPGYSGGGVNEIQTAMSVWDGYSAAKINYVYSGVGSGSPVGLSRPNGINEILFNDPLNEISGSWNPSTGGVVGMGGFNGVSGTSSWTAPFTADATHTQRTYTAYNIVEGNLTIQDNVQAAQGISSGTLAEIVAHEFGHTLGFGHSADSTALMYATVSPGGASLRADDQNAARWLYPNGSQSTPTPPPTATVPAAPTNLSVTVSGTTATLRWTDNATNETGQDIWVSAGSGSFTSVGTVAAGTTGATVSGFSSGSYRTYVTASNSAGTSAPSNTVAFTVASQLAQLVAGFNYGPANATTDQSISFYDQSSGGATSWQWNFGDGTSSTAQNPVKRFGAAGTYSVSLTITRNTDGATASTAQNVTVSTPAPTLPPLTAGISWSPANATTADNVSFADQSSGSPTQWAWNFGDGTSSAAQNPVKRYGVAGTYTVTLTVRRGADNASSTTSRNISVVNAAPAIPPVSAAFAFAPQSPTAGDNVVFTDQSAGAPTAWLWNFGDGATSSSQNPAHVYAAAGTYTVTMTTSNAVSSSTASKTISVASRVQTWRSLVSAAAQTAGLGGSYWRTEVTLFNAGPGVAVTLTFIPAANEATQTRTMYLGQMQSMTWNNALPDIFGMATGAGAIEFEASSTSFSPALRVTSRTFTTGANGTYGQGVPEVSSDELQPSAYLTGLVSNSAYRTNIGLVNRSNAPANATLTLLDVNGGVLGQTTVTVPANYFQQSTLAALFPAVASTAVDAMSMRVASSAASAMSVSASVIDNTSQDPTFIQGSRTATGSSLMLPGVGRTPGAGGTYWRSDVSIFNPSAATSVLSMRYLPSGADNRFVPATNVIVGPGQTLLLRDVTSRLGAADGMGAMEIAWSGGAGPVVSSRTYTTSPAGGTYGQSVDPIASWGSEMFVTGLRSDNAYRSNIGFVNNGDQTIGVAITLLSPSGQTLGTGFVAIAPKSQSLASVAALFPSLPVATLGSFTLKAHTDTAPTMFAYGSVVDNASGDPIYLAGR